MNKILKIIIKSDPIFKYVVEDYPFYEGILFYSYDLHSMKIKNSHSFLNRKIKILKGQNKDFHLLKFLQKLTIDINTSNTQMNLNLRCRLKQKGKFNYLSSLKTKSKLDLRLKFKNNNYSSLKAKLHLIKLTRLKTHDPYPIENRDMLKLSNMDGEKYI